MYSYRQTLKMDNTLIVDGTTWVHLGYLILRAGYFRLLWGIFGSNGLFKDSFIFEGRRYIPLSSLDAHLNEQEIMIAKNKGAFKG